MCICVYLGVERWKLKSAVLVFDSRIIFGYTCNLRLYVFDVGTYVWMWMLCDVYSILLAKTSTVKYHPLHVRNFFVAFESWGTQTAFNAIRPTTCAISSIKRSLFWLPSYFPTFFTTAITAGIVVLAVSTGGLHCGCIHFEGEKSGIVCWRAVCGLMMFLSESVVAKY